MAIVSAGKLALLRGKYQRTKVFGSFHNPTTLWQAQVTGGPSRADRTITFNNGSGSSFALIEALQEVLVGSVVNSLDVGRLRVRSIASGDGGITGTLTVGHNGLILTNGDWLTFKLDYPLKPWWPRITGTPASPIFNKDYDITYTDENNLLRPIVIAGGNKAGFIDSTLGYWEVNPQLNNSYSIHPGSAITTYAAVALPAAGVTITINAGTGVGTIRFATAGNYWIKYTITDANATTQTSYRFYRVHLNDPTSEHYPLIDFTVSNITGDWDRGGWTAGIAVHDNVTLSAFPDRCIAILWQHDTYYDETAGGITFDNETDTTTLISGYLRKETLTKPLPTSSGADNLNTGAFSIETIDALLKNQFMYSISLEAKNSTPTEWYEFQTQLTCTRGVAHLWRYHSTLMFIADVVGLDTNTDFRAFVELENGNLYSMADNLLRNTGIRYHVVIDKYGRIHTIPDLQLLPDADRAALTEIFVLDNLDLSEDISIVRQVPFTTVLAKTSGFSWNAGFTSAASDTCPNPPCPTVEPFCAVQRNPIATDEGSQIIQLDRQTYRDPGGQTHANEIAGRLYAQANNSLKEIRLNFPGNYAGVLDVFQTGYYDYTLITTDTVRGISFTNKKLFLKNVQINVDVTKGIIVCSVVFEPDIEGTVGVPDVCKDELPSTEGETPNPTPAPAGNGEPLITGSSVYYYINQDWTLRTAEATSDLRKDPFWKSRQSSVDPLDAIVWRGGIGYVKRSIDAGQNWTTITPGTDPPNTAGDAPAPTVGVVEFEHLAMSHVNIGEAIFLVNWVSGSGAERAWLAYTDDDGVTWAWKFIQGTSGASNIALNANRIWETTVASGIQVTKKLLGMSPGCAVVVRTDQGFNLEAILFTWVGDVITIQDTITIDPNPAHGDVLEGVIQMTSTTFVVLNSDIGGENQYISLLSVGGGCTTLNLEQTFHLGNPVGILQATVAKMRKVSNTQVAVASYFGTASGGGTGTHVMDVQVIDVTPTTLALNKYINIPVVDPPPFYDPIGIKQFFNMDGSNFRIFYFSELAGFNVYRDVNINTGTVGSEINDPYVIPADQITIVERFEFSSQNIAIQCDNSVLFSNVIPMKAIKLGTGSLTVGTSLIYKPAVFGPPPYYDYNNITAIPVGGDNFMLIARRSGGTWYVVASFTVNPTTLDITYNGDEQAFVPSTFTDNGQSLGLMDTGVVGAIYATVNGAGGLGKIRFLGYTPPGLPNGPTLTNSIRGLGIDVDRVSANKSVITVGDNTDEQLFRMTYSLPALTLTGGDIIAENVTFTDIDDRVFWAYPLTSWFDANTYWIFGRFYDPNDLVTVNHLIVTTDNGTTWTTVLSGFGFDHIGAMYENFLAKLLFVKNDKTLLTGQVYYDFNPRFNLPFFGYVQAHGIAVNQAGTLYAASKVANAYMVTRMLAPYVGTNNITFDHGTGSGVNSIEHLQ